MRSRFFARSVEHAEAREDCVKSALCLTCCTGTAVTGWLWGTKIWEAMAAGGVNYTGRIFITIFAAGGFSVLGGLAATIGVGAIAGLAYCCYKSCKHDAEAITQNSTQQDLKEVLISMPSLGR